MNSWPRLYTTVITNIRILHQDIALKFKSINAEYLYNIRNIMNYFFFFVAVFNTDIVIGINL